MYVLLNGRGGEHINFLLFPMGELRSKPAIFLERIAFDVKGMTVLM